MKKQLLFTVFLIISLNKLMAEIPESERLVLNNLATSTDSENWSNFNWSDTIPVSSWYGIVVTTISGIDHVTEINLIYNNLSGTINLDIDNLPYLNKLSLADNNLTGNIPLTIGNLPNLSYLHLGQNNLTGSIPTTLGNLSNLTYLVLGSNNLTGSIPTTLGNLINLTNLSLGSNNLTGSIPSELGGLLNLEALNIDENQLSNSIPTELGNCVELYSLNLADNPITGEIPNELSSLTKMRYFNISNTLLSGDITNIYSSWPELIILNISSNLLTGNLDLSNNINLTKFFSGFTYLTTINIQNGANSIINQFIADNCSNLICVQVDNETDATNGNPPYTNWDIDSTTTFSEDCNGLNVLDYTLNNDLLFYPNPTTNHLYIKNNHSTNLEIEAYNILGKKLFSLTIENEINKIDFSNFKSGVYIIKSKNEDNSYAINKVIKN